MWRLGENLNVKYSLAARLVSGLSGPARMRCMTMDADQLHPSPGDGPVATADERRNVAGLDNVMNVLQSSPLVKKLPARKNELLHAFFRDDSLARTKGEPIAMWLVRHNEQLGKLNRVGLDIVTSLRDVAGCQALNLAGLTEDRIELVVSRLHDDTFPLDAISVELNRVFASVHMSEHVSSIPAIPPGRAWSSNERERVPRNPRSRHRWRQSRPTFAAKRTQNQSVSSAQWDTFEEVVDTEDEDNDGSDTIDPGDLQEYVRDELEVLATCMDNGENDAPVPGVDNSQLETACLKLAELPEALAIVQAARRGASDSNRHSRASRRQGQFSTTIRPTTCTQHCTSQQRRGTDLQAKLDKRKARSVCHACGQTGHWAGDPQCPGRPVNDVIKLEDDVQEFEPNQDAGTRQILSVQVDVSDVRFLRPSTRLVLAVNSMDVGRREGARGVIDTAARYTVAGRAWDRAYRRICAERGI